MTQSNSGLFEMLVKAKKDQIMPHGVVPPADSVIGVLISWYLFCFDGVCGYLDHILTGYGNIKVIC